MNRTLVRTKDGARSVISSNLEIADNFLSRSKGLLGRKTFDAGQGLLIKRCNSIHTCFMNFPIDAIFVDKNLRVVSLYHALKPWRITPLQFGASIVIELPAGTLTGTPDLLPGDVLTIEDGGPNA